ncbi:amidohydrolase [Spinactinospora alkalitolerans]|uniref:Peptidase M20 domain-containing protein 2 n=1 Tax=Spinactinospora alkalitolerans TaxID=687207 RepID=A0A852TT04_9ACTN|nr:amidohydrolase [Spinactinospora alkalitolerans]NYE47058.1 amidohydrolase [Spinactinospora alkalitolerans]
MSDTTATDAAAERARLKAAVCAEIDRRAEEVTAVSEEVLRHPETGWRETRTSERVRRWFDGMGLAHEDGLAGTGVKARMRGRTSRRTVAVLGELDSLLVSGHPYADPETGAAHACGHNAQIASMIGAGFGLAPVMDRLDGDVALFAVPAEECIEVDWRLSRREAGDFEFILGKPELIRLGAFDDVDIAMMTHAGPMVSSPAAAVAMSANGSLVKRVTFTGVAAHAGATPWAGANALKAATLAIAAIDAQRDTFDDADTVRVSQILTGGEAVSAVPARADMELMIRAGTVAAMRDAAAKVDRALRAGAFALGVDVRIETVGGYLPLETDAPLADLMYANCTDLFGVRETVRDGGRMGGSTDAGDLGHIMPVVHPWAASGSSAAFHGPGFHTADHVAAAVNPAKFMAMTVVDLLCDGAAGADRVVAESGPKMSREAYLELRRSFDTVTGGIVEH